MPEIRGRSFEYIVFDEASEIKEEDWKGKLTKNLSERIEGTFTDAATFTEAATFTTGVKEDLTIDKLKEAMALIGDSDMARKKIPKKKKVRGDPRRVKFSGRMFGNILLSTTSQIENNTTLNDALVLEGAANTTVEELIAPLFDEFFLKHGKNWQVTGPMSLAAQSVETSKWKNVSALGGEVLEYHSAVMGKRDGICIKWTTGNIVGMDDEMMIDTTIKNFGDKLVHAELGGNPANRATVLDVLLDFAGEADVVTAAEESKERVRVAVQAQLKEDIERKSEAYGESFGSWA